MGTSTDRTEGRGGPWTPLKYAATSYVRGLGAASDRAGRGGLQRLGALLAGIEDHGLGPTLVDLGLAPLVGLSRFDVLDELVTLIAGDGDDLDSQAARDAACDVLDELFQGADTWEQLEAATVSADELRGLLEVFLATTCTTGYRSSPNGSADSPTRRRCAGPTRSCARSSRTWSRSACPPTRSPWTGLAPKA